MHWDAEHRLVMIMHMQHVERAVLAVPPLAALACWGGLSCSAGPGRHHNTATLSLSLSLSLSHRRYERSYDPPDPDPDPNHDPN